MPFPFRKKGHPRQEEPGCMEELIVSQLAGQLGWVSVRGMRQSAPRAGAGSGSSLADVIQGATGQEGGERQVGGVGPVQVAQHARQACSGGGTAAGASLSEAHG